MFHNTFQSGSSSHPFQLWDVRFEQSSELDRRGRIRCTDDTDPGGIDEVVGPTIEISGPKLSRNYIICPPKSKTTTTRPSLGITLPYLYLTVRVPTSQSDFSFEVTILDDRQTIRRFRASTYQSATLIKPDICVMPLRLERQRRRLARDTVLLPAKKQKVDGEHHIYPEDGNFYDKGSYYGPGGHNSDDSGEDDEDCNDITETFPCWNRLCVPLSEYTRRAYGTNYVETMWVQIHANCRLKRVYFADREVNEDDELPEEFRLYHRHPTGVNPEVQVLQEGPS
ncbi:hypothetical protein ACHAW5_004123 [Stephanodiscus triporus]|uniref:CFA20 domain-containing protein n=1 Tax=Stephanodiscus triporus TaxID=2934178 RepID=A0ABD3QGA0_9STRA